MKRAIVPFVKTVTILDSPVGCEINLVGGEINLVGTNSVCKNEMEQRIKECITLHKGKYYVKCLLHPHMCISWATV